MKENRLNRDDNKEKEKSFEEWEESTDEHLVQSEKSVKAYQFFFIRLIIFLLVLWVLFFKVIGLTHMPSEDMRPRLMAGDLLLFYRLDRSIQSKDVVVFEKEGTMYVGRVVGVAGDSIEVSENSHLIVNGNAVTEPDIYYTTPAYEEGIEYPVTLGDGEYFILGDMREGAVDSRVFGPVSRKEISGTVINVIRRNNI